MAEVAEQTTAVDGHHAPDSGPRIGILVVAYNAASTLASVLDRMYGRLSTLFAVPAGENLWRGKALVFVFSREEDYLKFEVKMHSTVAAGTAGMCHA